MPEGQLELASVEAGTGPGPVLRGEFEVPVAGPVRHLGEVSLDVELL